MSAIAAFTAVYPAALQYFGEWYGSLLTQTENDFDLWIALDGVTPDELVQCAGTRVRAEFHIAARGENPVEIRNAALLAMLASHRYESLVLLDCDDILLPTRISAARQVLEGCDACACGMELVDGQGKSLGLRFGLPEGEWSLAMLVRENVFGFSNTAYRAPLLQSVLPAPRDCRLMDWLVITRAAAQDAELCFDSAARMAYRQHAENVSRVVPPFHAEDIRRATGLVLDHYDLLLTDLPPGPWRDQLVLAATNAQTFARYIAAEDHLRAYLAALNSLPPRLTWWAAVARPELEAMWNY
jgi:hypothetical protein